MACIVGIRELEVAGLFRTGPRIPQTLARLGMVQHAQTFVKAEPKFCLRLKLPTTRKRNLQPDFTI